MVWAQVPKALSLKGPQPSLKVIESFVRPATRWHEERVKKIVQCSLKKITHRGKGSVPQILKQVSHKEGWDSFSKDPQPEQWELLEEIVPSVKKDFLDPGPPGTGISHLRPQRAHVTEDSQNQTTRRTQRSSPFRGVWCLLSSVYTLGSWKGMAPCARTTAGKRAS